MVNPYDPRIPAEPDEFGGRKSILKAFHEQIENASALRHSGGMLIQGFRGVGKSSLIRKLVSIVESPEADIAGGAFVASCRLSKTTSDSDLYQMIINNLFDDLSRKQSLVQRVVGLKDRIKSAGIFDFRMEFDKLNTGRPPQNQWRDLLNRMRGAGLIMVAIDDADYLSPEAIGELKTIVEEQKEVPVLLVIAGGMEMEQRMIDNYSPVARIFSNTSFNISNFELEETREVLQKPIQNMSEVTWTEDGIAAMQEITKGYPYLVKCLANASYITDVPIDKTRVKASLPAALNIAKPWLDSKLREASDRDVEYFYKIASSNRTSFRNADLNRLGVPPPYIGRLVKLKVLKLVSRGHYDLIEAPMIAYYHMLKRQLPMDTG